MEAADVLGPRDRHRAERGQVVGDPLHVEQFGSGVVQPVDQGDERWILPASDAFGRHPWYQSQSRERQIEIGMWRQANVAKVGDVVKKAEKDVGAPIKVTGFVRYALGEGIEKEETDFAAEVAATAGHSAPDPK